MPRRKSSGWLRGACPTFSLVANRLFCMAWQSASLRTNSGGAKRICQSRMDRTSRTPSIRYPLPKDQLDRRRARQLLDAVLQRLPHELRTVLVLFEIEGLELKEIAEIEGLPVGTVGLFVLALLFIGTLAVTNAPRSTAQDKEQGKVQGPNAKPTVPPPPSPPPAVDHVFEIDGNSFLETVVGEDWNQINPADGQSRTGPVAGSAAQNATFVADVDTASFTDTYFTGGSSKDFIDIEGNWQITTNSVPNKDQINNAYAATYIDTTGVACTSPGVPVGCNEQFGHKVLVFGGDRFATNGDANIGFWFFKGEVSVDVANGVFHGSHQNGDLFIVSAFTGGGGTSTIDVYEWVGTPNPGDPTETNLDRCNDLGGILDTSGDDTICKLTAAGKATGIVNPVDLTGDQGLGWPYTFTPGGTPCPAPGNPLPCDAQKGAFYEGGIDLTALGLDTTCFASFMLETRSSASVDAVLKDFALGNFESCSATCDKSVNLGDVCEDPANPGFSTPVIYTYSSTNTGGTALGQTFHDDNGTPANTADDFYITGGVTTAPFGTCTTGASAVTFTVNPGETKGCTLSKTLPVGATSTEITDTLTIATVSPVGALEDCTNTAVVEVHPRPSVSISVLTCPGAAQTSFNLTATASGGTPPYRISMGGESCGGTGEPACGGVDQNTLTINRTIGGSYTATVTDASNLAGCAATATRNVGYCSD